jgi:PAS domain S-box-containing protein
MMNRQDRQDRQEDELGSSAEPAAVLTKLAAHLPGVVHLVTVDPQGLTRIPYASEGLKRLFGLSPDEVRGDAGRLFKIVHPDDRQSLRQSILQSQRSLQPWHAEYRVCPPGGGERWVETQALPERLADGSTVWHGYSDDITERKQAQIALAASEARWQQAADAAGIGVVRFHLAGDSVQLDAQARVMHGECAAQSTVDRWAARLADEDRPAVLAALRRAAQAGGAERFEARYRYRQADGSLRWLETAARAHAGADAQALVGTCRDVTAQQEAEQLRRDRDTAEHMARAQSELLSRLSHELRTPLNGIQGFAQLMALDQEEPLGPTQQRRLANVQRAGKHLLKLVDGVLELTRLEQGEVALQRRSIDLLRILRHTLDLVRPLALNIGVVLPAVLPNTPVGVLADARALEQVFVNLLAHTIQNNRPRGAVGITIERVPGRVAVVVTDEGPGFTPAQQALLFEPLQSSHGQSRGLGLAIARRLAMAMDGTLDVTSEPGRGSRFRIELPASDQAALEDSGPVSLLAPLSTPASLEGTGAGPRSVLYIEDEPLNVLLMEEVFRGQPQWRLEVARDGRRGLERAREAPPDLLLVDMNLPDMNGLQVVNSLRAEPSTAHLLCIALSADALPEQIAAARSGGFDDYWTKPIDVARLLAALGRAIERRDGAATG